MTDPRLLRAKLTGLVRARWGAAPAIDEPNGPAVGIVDDPRGPVAVGLGTSERALGPLLAWAERSGAVGVAVLADDPVAGALARRAEPFDDVEVFAVAGTDLVPASPTPLAPPPELPAAHWALAALLVDAGARAVDDHGRLVAEVRGLEVARIVDGVDEPGPADEGPRLLVGVGQADRELQVLVHGADDPDAALRRAIATVVGERRAGSMHPLARIARERWLRSHLVDDPSIIGASSLEPVPPLRPRDTVLGNVPVAACGLDLDGAPVVVVTSVGIDLDLAPEAADYRRREDPSATLVVAIPERDRHPRLTSVVERLPAARVVGVEPPWSSTVAPTRA